MPPAADFRVAALALLCMHQSPIPASRRLLLLLLLLLLIPALMCSHGRRQRRLKEMREEAKTPLFGTVEQISGSDYVREITNAGEDVWVVLHLFKDG